MKVVTFVAAVFLLGLLGYQGRERAWRQMRLGELSLGREQLQQALDRDDRPNAQLPDVVLGTAASAPSTLDSEIKKRADSLTAEITRFESDYPTGTLAVLDACQVRLSQATVANAEQRFGEALRLTSGGEDAWKPGQAKRDEVLRVRGDSFYGLGDWANAKTRYDQLLAGHSDWILILARVANCQNSLGQAAEALGACQKVARAHDDRGNGLLAQGNPEAALKHYEKAIQIQSWLIEHKGRSELMADLALSQYGEATAFLIQEKPGPALSHCQKALDIQKQLYESGRGELGGALAMSYYQLGNALFCQQLMEPALASYATVMEVQTRLSPETKAQIISEVAMSHNNRGVIYRAQGRVEAAIEEFETATKTLSPLIDRVPQGPDLPAASSPLARGEWSAPLHLDVAIDYGEKNVEISTRAALAPAVHQKNLAVGLAITFKNCGYAHMMWGKPDLALANFQRATEIYSRLVDKQGQQDLAVDLADNLSAVAWLYATTPVSSIRDGTKARQYALRACETSEWRLPAAIEALAASYAEMGTFSQAVKWQEKALELTPGEAKTTAHVRLELYKSGNPYRAAPIKTN